MLAYISTNPLWLVLTFFRNYLPNIQPNPVGIGQTKTWSWTRSAKLRATYLVVTYSSMSHTIDNKKMKIITFLYITSVNDKRKGSWMWVLSNGKPSAQHKGTSFHYSMRWGRWDICLFASLREETCDQNFEHPNHIGITLASVGSNPCTQNRKPTCRIVWSNIFLPPQVALDLLPNTWPSLS